MSFEDKKISSSKEVIQFSDRISHSLRTTDSYEEVENMLSRVDERIDFYKNSGFTANFAFLDVVEDCYDAGLQREKPQFLSRESEYYGKLGGMSPRVADFYQGFLAELYQKDYECRFPINQKKIAQLKEAQDFEVLFDEMYGLPLKSNRLQKGLSGFIASLRALDKRDGNEMTDEIREERKRKLSEQPKNPSSKRSSSRPGVDEMDRLKEGEKAPALWTITPPWGGFYKETTLTQWDNATSTWSENKFTQSPYVFYKAETKKELSVLRATIDSDREIPVPLPYTHGIVSVTTDKGTCEVFQDQFGDASVVLRGASSAEISITITPVTKKPKGAPGKPPEFISTFTPETEAELARIKGFKGSLAQYKELRQYIFKNITYLLPKDAVEADRYNQIYRTDARGFAGAVDAVKTGDCDTVNTYFSALCSRLGIASRHCLGHMVKGKGESGGSEINSGTGHGWTEIWDDQSREWVRADVTPPGDPNTESPENQEKANSVPGDYGETPPSEQKEDKRDLTQLRKEVDELRKKLSYTKEERSIAEAAGVSLAEARLFVKEIHDAEKMMLLNGERILDVLSQVFSVILQSRKDNAISYDGPVRRREGGERISHLVKHKIGMMSGDSDPISRELEVEETEVRHMSGGFDVFMIGDRSASMGTQYKDETFLSFQRKVLYLITAAMHNFQSNISRESLSKESEFSVRSEVMTFDPGITVEKKLGDPFSSLMRYQLWGGLGKLGGGNDEVSALHGVINSIEEDRKSLKKLGKKEDRVRLVILCSDGGIMGEEEIAAMQVLMEKLTEMGAVAVGIGLSPQATVIPTCFHNPPHSYGYTLDNIEELPLVVAQQVVARAIELMPSDKKAEAKHLMAEVMKKLS